MLAPHMIRVSALTFDRPGGFRLRLDALTVAPGERVAVTGPSGAGKTTLVLLLAGLLRPAAGAVEVAGVDPHDPSAARRARATDVGLVLQHLALLDHLSVLDNLRLPARLAGARPDDARARDLLDRLGLADRAAAHPPHLSQGERQRVAVARALMRRPRVLLADEPTAALDAARSAAVAELFAEAAADGAAVLLTTHDHALAATCDRTVELAS